MLQLYPPGTLGIVKSASIAFFATSGDAPGMEENDQLGYSFVEDMQTVDSGFNPIGLICCQTLSPLG